LTAWLSTGISDEGKRKAVREKLETYMSRAEVVKGYAKDGKLGTSSNSISYKHYKIILAYI
jgi:hypothetical protein